MMELEMKEQGMEEKKNPAILIQFPVLLSAFFVQVEQAPWGYCSLALREFWMLLSEVWSSAIYRYQL